MKSTASMMEAQRTRRAWLMNMGASALVLGLEGCGGGESDSPGAPAPMSPQEPVQPSTEAPAIGSITPAGGPAGTAVVIAGSGFERDAAVAIGGARVMASFVNANELRAVIGISPLRGPIDVRVEQGSGSATLAGGFWMTASGLPGNDPLLRSAGVPSAIRNETVWRAEVVRPEYGYQPWMAMIAPMGEEKAVAEVDYLELVVRFPDGSRRLVTRDDFGIESAMRSRAWGELLWRNPWGRSSGYRESYLSLAPASNPGMLVLDQSRAPAGLGDALYFHSWTRDWDVDPATGRDIGRANIPFIVPAGSQLLLHAAFRSRDRALFQIGLDRYATRAGSELIELALSDYHMNESDSWQVVSLAVNARS